MKLTFLGTGTSTGVPQIGCGCEVCRSTDPRDSRLRCSAHIMTDDGRGVLIDCGPDFRTQILRAGQPPVDAVMLTHIHYDHVGGVDDLRPYCHRPGRDGLDVWCRRDVADGLRHNLPYVFAESPYPGVPRLQLRELTEGKPFEVCGLTVMPLIVNHYLLPILCFRIGDRLGYVTDCKTMPAATAEALQGVDTLVINALRHETHLSHMNLQEALDVISVIRPRRALLTHLSHHMGLHAAASLGLPKGVEIATDGLTVEI